MTLSFELFSAFEVSFLLQNSQNLCFYQNLYVVGTPIQGGFVCSKKYWNFLWIWTNHRQLLNWQTLECMTEQNLGQRLRMKKCDINDRKQLWECVGNDIVQRQSGRYMYGYGLHVTTTTTSSDATKWKRYGTKENVCSQGKPRQNLEHSELFCYINFLSPSANCVSVVFGCLR